MTVKKRWIEAVVDTAEKLDAQMPWARGERRQAMIAKRDAEEQSKRSA